MINKKLKHRKRQNNYKMSNKKINIYQSLLKFPINNNQMSQFQNKKILKLPNKPRKRKNY